MRILTIGDVVGPAGVDFLQKNLYDIQKKYLVDMIIANGENAAFGNGLDVETSERIFASGVDVITSGNHIWNKHEMQKRIDDFPNILRPANYPSTCPGNPYVIFNASGNKVLVISLLGNVYMDSYSSPFETVNRILNRENGNYDYCVIDFHAEATSEKCALAKYFDGKVTAVVGTHTHVQTADARVLTGGTAFITDLGMTAAHDSILGIKNEIIIEKFLTKMPIRFVQEEGAIQFNAAVIETTNDGVKAKSIQSIYEIY